VWEDNFDGGLGQWTVVDGNFSTNDGILQAAGGVSRVHIVERSSTVAYGTWSFDVYINATAGSYWAYVLFLAGPLEGESYAIGLSAGGAISEPSISLISEGEFLEIKDVGSVSGWNHIDVTRDLNGQFFVFHDGTLLIETIDNTYTTSHNFTFTALTEGHALDNITVDDEITVWPKPSDLQLHSASIRPRSLSVLQNSNNIVRFSVINEGEQPGSGSLTAGATPNGISVTFNPSTITDLKAYQFGYEQRVEATVTASASVEPGDYEVIVELQNASHVLDTMSLDITILETTVQATSSAGTSSETQPQDETTSQGLTIFGILLTISVMVTLRRKRN
jgi:hypothetical protein